MSRRRMAATAAAHAEAPLCSPHWFRVARWRPLLDPAVGVQRQVVRGRVWHQLVPPDGGRGHRLDAAAWSVIGRCDGETPLQRLWDAALQALGDDAPTQDELLDMLVRLHGAGLLRWDRTLDASAGPAWPLGADRLAGRRAVPAEGGEADGRSLLSWRVPLGCPDALLARWAPRCRVLFSPIGLLLWALLVGAAAVAAAGHTGEIMGPLQAEWGSPRLLWVAAVVYLPMKLLHELAHGLAARTFGASVPRWGITWLSGFPVPYVDASAASALPRRRQRLAVAGAGIAAELALAALGLGLALASQPGALQDLGLVLVYLGTFSSLLVNANPLLRFDGYHMACDALDLPNLATRSSRHWLSLLRRRWLGLDEAPAVQPARGERVWLWAYAPASWLMRWALVLSLTFWLGSLSTGLGVVAALAFGLALVARPLGSLLRWWHGLTGDRSARRAQLRLALSAGAVLLPLALWPWPDATVVQGVLWLPESAQVRAGTAGTVAQLLVRDGQPVVAGQALVRLQSPEREAQAQALRSRMVALRSARAQSLRDAPEQAAQAGHALQATAAELARVESDLDQLLVRAPSAGRVAVAHAQDWPGRSVARGALLLHVLGDAPGRVQVAIPQSHAARLATQPGAVAVRMAGGHGAVRTGVWNGLISGGQSRLPSAALGERAGGRIALDANDPEGLRSAQPVVIGEVLLDGPPPQRLGERVLVRIVHGQATLAAQWARWLQQQVLRQFNPAV